MATPRLAQWRLRLRPAIRSRLAPDRTSSLRVTAQDSEYLRPVEDLRVQDHVEHGRFHGSDRFTVNVDRRVVMPRNCVINAEHEA